MDSQGKRKVIRVSVWVAILGMLFGVLSSIILATGADAHAALKSVSPKDGSTLAAAPSKVVLTFDEPIGTSFATVQVTGPAGVVSKGKPVVHGATVTQVLADDLPDGGYQVAFHVVSDDGHPVSEVTTFTVAAATTATPSTAAGQPTATPGTAATAGPAPGGTSAGPGGTSAGAGGTGAGAGGTGAAPAAAGERGGIPASWWITAAALAALVLAGGLTLASRTRRQADE